MKHWLTALFILALSTSHGLSEKITIKSLDDVIREIPQPAGKGFLTREVIKVKGYYRGERLVLLEHDSELTLNTKDKTTTTRSTAYFVVAGGEKILRIEGGTFKISFVASGWPIHINHVCHEDEGKGTGRSSICVPEIGFFEYLEFEDGNLLPLLDGPEFENFSKVNLEGARKLLTRNPDKSE